MYETFYQLSGMPFQLNPDPAFFYGGKEHSGAFSYMRYAVYQGEGFLVVTGDIGTGKTTLVRTLMEAIDPKVVVAVQLVSTQLEADDLLRSVAAAFGLPAVNVDKAQLLAYIETYLTSLLVEKKRALLIVDEAQNLAPRAMEELRMLSNFQYGNRALLQSFLVGQPELRATLEAPKMQQLRQRVIASFHLRPLDLDGTRAYIQHRLRRVNWQQDPEFDPDIFPVIYEATNGVPRRINTFANRLLLAAFLSEKHELGAADAIAVAQELHAELGPGISLPSHEPLAMNGSAAATPVSDAAMLARLERIENVSKATFDLLRSMVDPPPESSRRRTRPGKSN